MDRTKIIYTSIKYKLLFFVLTIIFRFGFMENHKTAVLMHFYLVV